MKRIFISYSHKDQEFLDRILIHLKPLEKFGIDSWSDLRLRPGDRWRQEIAQAIEGATVAILLFSADFMASDFINQNEVPKLLVRADEQGTRIVPVILKACGFEREKVLSQFQSLNDPRETIARMTDAKREKYYDKLAAEVEQIFHGELAVQTSVDVNSRSSVSTTVNLEIDALLKERKRLTREKEIERDQLEDDWDHQRQAIDNDFARRNMFHSGMRLAAQRQLEKERARQIEKHNLAFERKLEHIERRIEELRSNSFRS